MLGVWCHIQPYNVGLVSARPFVILGEYGPPTFQRGVLHVYFAAVELHVMVVHLHAHSSQHRISEAAALVKVSSPSHRWDGLPLALRRIVKGRKHPFLIIMRVVVPVLLYGNMSE